jgi:hypothetical protein
MVVMIHDNAMNVYVVDFVDDVHSHVRVVGDDVGVVVDELVRANMVKLKLKRRVKQAAHTGFHSIKHVLLYIHGLDDEKLSKTSQVSYTLWALLVCESRSISMLVHSCTAQRLI